MNLEISYVAKLRGDTTHQRAITSFSAATQNLVKNLTDIEPYEPYWEYTRQLRLVKKGLVTLHPLNEFCPRIEDLNVQGNELGQVTGVPTTVRELNISDNCLSSLTTWGHLLNLQYLDVSRNGLDSLAGEQTPPLHPPYILNKANLSMKLITNRVETSRSFKRTTCRREQYHRH